MGPLDPRNPAPAPGKPRPALLAALTSIRFLAALQVLLYHFYPQYQTSGSLRWLVGSGYTGVTFFFVLSGFILVYSHAAEYAEGRVSAKRFYFARFARVYPTYFVALLITFVIERRLLLKPIHLVAMLTDLTMIQAWSTKTAIFFLAPAWTLSNEAFFYLLFPLLILKLRPSSRSQGIACIACFWMLSAIGPLVYLNHSFGLHWTEWLPKHDSPLLDVFEFTPLFHLPEFLAGMVLGWIAVRFPPEKRHGLALGSSGALSILVALWASPHLPYILLHDGLLIPAYSLLILGLSQPNALSRALSVKPLILLGEASFALYLYHWFLSWYFPSATVWSGAWKILLCIPLSVAIHLGLERPARKHLLYWWNSKPGRMAQRNA